MTSSFRYVLQIMVVILLVSRDCWGWGWGGADNTQDDLYNTAIYTYRDISSACCIYIFIYIYENYIERCNCFYCQRYLIHLLSFAEKQPDVNCLLVLAMRCIGKGRSGAMTMSSLLDLPPSVTSRPWTKHVEQWTDIAGVVLNKQFDEANQRARNSQHAPG